MLGGYAGKILRLDLTGKKHGVEELGEDFVKVKLDDGTIVCNKNIWWTEI